MFEQSGDLQNSVRRGPRCGQYEPTVGLPGVGMAPQQDPDSGGVEERHPVEVDLDVSGPLPAQDLDDRFGESVGAPRVDLAG